MEQAIRQLPWIQRIAGIDQPVVDSRARSARQKCCHVRQCLAVHITEQLANRLTGQTPDMTRTLKQTSINEQV